MPRLKAASAAFFIALATALLLGAGARAQGTMQVLGPTTAGHLAMYLGHGGQAIDAGGPTTTNGPPQNSLNPGSLPTGLGIVNSGVGNCQWSQYATAPYSEMCWGFDGNGNALLNVDRVGGGNPPGFNIVVNGIATTIGTANNPLAYINVTSPPYNLKGDGATDNTAGFRAACLAASIARSTLFFPPGTYPWTQTVPCSWAKILGSGNNSTFFVFDDASGTQDGITVGNATFNLNETNYARKQAATGGALIHFTDSYWASVYNNVFSGYAFDAIKIDSVMGEPNEIFIYNNIARGFSGGIANDFVDIASLNAAYPALDIHVYDNFVYGTGVSAISLTGYGQVDLNHNTLAGGYTHGLYINTVASDSASTLSRVTTNDFDEAPIYIANYDDVLLSGNKMNVPVTIVNSQAVTMTGNDANCGADTCPILLQGVVLSSFTGNRINGQNNPITIQPSGSTRSASLSFVGNTWNLGTGSMLTFSGGAPAADDISAFGNHLDGSETLATFTTAPTNWRSTGDTAGPTAAPAVTCTGIGATGTCIPVPPGLIEGLTLSLNTAGGSEATSGLITFVYAGALGPLGSSCAPGLQNSGGLWPTTSTIILNGTSGTQVQLQWNTNGAALTDAKQYNITLRCSGY